MTITPTVELTEAECFELLDSQPVGRLAVARPDGPPMVVPVNYRRDGRAILFRTGPGLKVLLLRQSGSVSFQVDAIDWFHRTGWSVLVHGTAYEATHWETDHLDLESWTAGDKPTWVRIVTTVVTGRRIEPAELDWPGDPRGYL